MRHAEVRYFEGVDPEHVVLTEDGRAQAEAAAQTLRDVTPSDGTPHGLSPAPGPGERPGE